jgi:hypothetical protein
MDLGLALRDVGLDVGRKCNNSEHIRSETHETVEETDF